jgi:integrase
VRAWCDWCDRFGLPCLPGRAADVAAFLAAGRGLSVSTLTLRRAAIRYLHVAAGCSVPTAEAAVGETMAGITRHAAETGVVPARKRGAAAVTVAIPCGTTELCPVRALRQWQLAAGITDGPLFRRIWAPPRGRTGRNTPLPRVGYAAIDAGTIARVVQARAARAKAAGFDPDVLGGHSLKRGALSTGMERGIHPTRLKQLSRHKSYAVLDVYLELGDPFEAHPLNGVL